MIARRLLVMVGLIGCQGSATPSVDSPTSARAPADDSQAEVDDAAAELEPAGHGLECTMAGQACPSAELPRFDAQLDAAGWQRLRALADEGLVAVALSEHIELIESCSLPGAYHEAVASADSPGRAWSADRLVFLPDEPHGCERATHFVATFAIRGATDGQAIALPLPCPTTDAPAQGCIGAGLDAAAREQAARERWALAEQRVVGEGGRERALPLVVEVASLSPSARTYASLAQLLELLLDNRHGGCLWLSEAAFAARALDPEFSSVLDHTGTIDRLAPAHEPLQCLVRPSLLTCFPERYTPGIGDNCW